MNILSANKTGMALLMAALISFVLCPDLIAKKEKARTIPASPEPDPWVEPTPLQESLPDQEEAVCIVFGEFIEIEGIDVSHYQGEVDWKSVAAEGKISYAFMKATEGEGLTDEFYDYNIQEAKKAGLLVGSYHFFRAQIPVDNQIENMTATVKPEQQDLLPIIDVESANRQSKDRLVSRLKDFLLKVEKYYGKKPILYTYVNFYNKYLAGEGFEDYPLMIAFYREAQPELYDGRDYIIWQYTSQGSVPGVDGDVDCSKIMKGFSLKQILYK